MAKHVATALTTSVAFTLTSSRPDSSIDSLVFGAANSNLYLNLTEQNATCQYPVEDESATFYIRDSQLFLYATKAAPRSIYADRSGMGQGDVGYVTSGQGGLRYAEFEGWALNENNSLSLKGSKFIACPSHIDGAWSVWVHVGIDQPAGNMGCLTLSGHATENPSPIGCYYSQNTG